MSERYPQFAKIRLCKMQEYPQIDITGGTSQQSFLIVAGISLLSIFPAARLPKLPGEVSAEDIVSKARLERQGSESPVDSGSYRRSFGVESADAGANENEP